MGFTVDACCPKSQDPGFYQGCRPTWDLRDGEMSSEIQAWEALSVTGSESQELLFANPCVLVAVAGKEKPQTVAQAAQKPM